MRKEPVGWRKGYNWFLLGYVICVSLFFWIAHDQLYWLVERTIPVSAQSATGQLNSGDIVLQEYIPKKPNILAIDLYIGSLGHESDGFTHVSLINGERVLGEAELDNTQVKKDDWYSFRFNAPVEVIPDMPLVLQVEIIGASPNKGVTLYGGLGIDLGRGSVALEESTFAVNEQTVRGSLCFRANEQIPLISGYWYWPVVGGVGCVLIGLFITLAYKERKRLPSFILRYIALFHQYSFLADQLVRRDFKVKYKRSFLGVFWSFLNPVLTMIVQYVIFSTLFKTSIENFPVYLMTGIILFNFFTESVSLGLGSIVNNASLINKVYVPKYIYPLTRVMSSAINMLLALIPLLGLMAALGMPFTKALLLLPLVIFFLLIFCMGMSLLLSTCMVFFRDTQFLWGIVALLWTYLTPVFYPETIIPVTMLKIYHINPMYQFIYFMRSITISGISPSPITYLYCTLSSFVPLFVGLWVFKKHQDKFVLYL